MLRGENIVCFGKDWTDHPTSVNHVMNQLARHNKVLWLNSIGSRAPDFSSGRDLRKIARKLRSFVKPPEQVGQTMWTYSPAALPFPHSRLATRVNQEILRASIGLVRRSLGMERFQLWAFYPTPVTYVGKLGEDLSVYYVVDAYDKFDDMDKRRIAELDREFARKADLVFATANSLVELKRPLNPETHLASHGVDWEHFSSALAPDTEVAGDIAGLARPVVGFFGLLQSWVDQPLLVAVARAHRDWSVVVIGNHNCDVSRLAAEPNIHLLGGRDYRQLPRYCRGFDVGVIPFEVSELTSHVNPIKLREYLSAGLPVVSTPMPEVAYYSEHCSIADGPEAFVAAIEREIAGDSPERRRARSEAMKSERWEAVVGRVGDHVARVQAELRAVRNAG